MVDERECQICSGIFLDLPRYFDAIKSDLEKYEFNDLLVGSTFSEEILERESEMQGFLGGTGESIKKEFNREFGKLVSLRTGKLVNFKDPQMMIRMDMRYDSFSFQVKSLFVSGTYKKLVRGIPQTRWIHGDPSWPSVETVVGGKIILLCGSSNYYLHGAGREDVDVLMLGNGREFSIEVENPRLRSVKLSDLESLINGSGEGVEVSDLRFSSKEDVVKIKGEKNDKTYRIGLRFPSQIKKEKIEMIQEKFSGKEIYQRTPLRVSSRRSDLVRKREIREIRIEDISGNDVSLLITAESGTYIKELVHGDEGRTEPNISSEYGETPEILYLDVIGIQREK